MLLLLANITGVVVMVAYVYAGWHDRMEQFDWANFFGGIILVPANIMVALSVGAWFGVVLSSGFWVGSIVNLTKRYMNERRRGRMEVE